MRGVRSAGLCLAACLAAGDAGAQARPSVAEMQARSAEIAQTYLATWSRDGEASIASVPNVYGPRVQFYGRNLSYAALAAEKRRALERWPLRSYTARPGSITVVCNESTLKCAVRAIVDYRVEDRRGRAMSGATSFDLGIGFAGPRPVVLYENGRVLRSRGRG